ncbi:MAG: shikimate kinase [Oscillospiraceae bacterium]|nr:shikimate kinase [Oscillospiraceae bacterium]
MKDNIVLIGMPGSGKSTVGVLLAKIIGYDFLDSDLLIQNTEGRRLCEIINDSGAEYFKKLENRVNKEINASKTVIATGGSVVYGKDAMEHFKNIGKIVYLKVPLTEIKQRINNLATRGIVRNEGQTLDEIYEERAPLYEKYANITVNCGKGSLSYNAHKIMKALGF